MRNPSPATCRANTVLSGRIQFLGRAMVVVFLLVWVSWMFPYDDLLDRRGTPLGADYAMFYVAGQVALDGEADHLYDQAEHHRRLQSLFPGIDERFCLPYRYPPFVAFLMAPLAMLPYAISYACFLAISVGAWIAAIRLLANHLPMLGGSWRRSLFWAIAGWPVAWETWIGGQASMLAVLIAAGSFVLLQRGRVVLAGAVLALALYKPNVLALVAVGVALRYPRVLLGAIPVVASIVLASLLPAGWKVWHAYGTLSSQLALQSWDVATPYWKVHGMTSWLSLLLGEQGRISSVGIGLALTVLVAWLWRRADARDPGAAPLAFGILISLNALFNSYTPIYDLTLLLVGCLLTIESVARRHGESILQHPWLAQLMLAALYFGPHISQGICQVAGFQLFSLVLLGLLVWQFRQWNQGSAGVLVGYPISR